MLNYGRDYLSTFDTVMSKMKHGNFDTFFNENYHFVRDRVNSKIQDDELNLDITQNVFIHLWRHFDFIKKRDYPEAVIVKTINQEISNYFRKNTSENVYLHDFQLLQEDEELENLHLKDSLLDRLLDAL